MHTVNSHGSVTDAGETSFVLACGLRIAEAELELGASLKVRRLDHRLSVFDLAAVGVAGFRQWAALEPFAQSAQAEFVSPAVPESEEGYDALNMAWLASSLFMFRGFAAHFCPVVSSYSWNDVAGRQPTLGSAASREPQKQESVQRAVINPPSALPPFRGGLLDYHVRFFVTRDVRKDPVTRSDAEWVCQHIGRFNLLAAKDERFRFALQASIDWRFASDWRAAMARLWAGVEALFGVNSELVYRISLMVAACLEERGPARIARFKDVKRLYALRSKAVHGENLPEERLVAAVHDTYAILRALLIEAVDRGGLRDDEAHLLELLG